MRLLTGGRTDIAFLELAQEQFDVVDIEICNQSGADVRYDVANGRARSQPIRIRPPLTFAVGYPLR